MDLGLENKRALVLAGTSGLGRATAQALANDGAKVVLNGRSAERAAAVAGEVKAEAGPGAFVRGLGADVTAPAELERLVANAVDTLGGLDQLVINAGGPKAGGFEDLSDEDWASAFELTLMSVVRTVRLALPHLRAAGGGSVVA
ncbi:MAG: SDR family NAD(P)-dependent oxidoreductase, partial [Trueperaceae bacterium]